MQPLHAAKSVWLENSQREKYVMIYSGVFCLVMILPYFSHGEASVIPVYNFYLLLFGMPHNYLTWASIFSGGGTPLLTSRAFWIPIGVAFLAVVGLMGFPNGTVEVAILNLITYVSLWHAYRQHHGICKVYDAVQAQRMGDSSIFSDRKILNVFLLFSLFSVLIWAFTQEEVRFLLSADAQYNLWYPRLPHRFFVLWVVVTAVLGIWGVKRAYWDRWRQGKYLPIPQGATMLVATLTYVVPYFYLPLSALPISIAIGTMYHNIQYFGFVWLYEKNYAHVRQAEGGDLSHLQTISYQGDWKRYFSYAFLYSLSIFLLYGLLPHHWMLPVIYFLAFSHYLVDGVMWQKKHNGNLSPVLRRLADA